MSNSIIGVRISVKDRQLIQRVCRARGEDLSDFVRRSIKKELALLSYLPAEDMKALGIQTRKGGSR
jgi:hypothetical protein